MPTLTTAQRLARLNHAADTFKPTGRAISLGEIRHHALLVARQIQETQENFLDDPRYLALDAITGGLEAAIAGLRIFEQLTQQG